MIIDCSIVSGDSIKLSYTEDVNVNVEHYDVESCCEAVLY